MARHLKLFPVAALLLLSVACSDSAQKITEEFLATSSTDEMHVLARKARSLGKEGIPILLRVISVSMENQLRLDNYARLNISLRNLYDMAVDEIYTKDEVYFLVEVLSKQRVLDDTIVTAEIIKLITGVDVGYKEEFIKSYTPEDEQKRIEMISKWRSFLKEGQGKE